MPTVVTRTKGGEAVLASLHAVSCTAPWGLFRQTFRCHVVLLPLCNHMLGIPAASFSRVNPSSSDRIRHSSSQFSRTVHEHNGSIFNVTSSVLLVLSSLVSIPHHREHPKTHLLRSESTIFIAEVTSLTFGNHCLHDQVPGALSIIKRLGEENGTQEGSVSRPLHHQSA